MRWIVGWENETDKQQPYIVQRFQTAKELLDIELKWSYIDTGNYEYLLAQNSLKTAAGEWKYTIGTTTFFIKDWATTLREEDLKNGTTS